MEGGERISGTQLTVEITEVGCVPRPGEHERFAQAGACWSRELTSTSPLQMRYESGEPSTRGGSIAAAAHEHVE